jgi:PhnB protein
MICLNVFFKKNEEVCEAFESLKENGQIDVELGPQFFSPMYGSIIDKYRVKWQLISEE